jgi:hypothetical protein
MKSLIVVLVLLSAAALANAESAVTTRATELQASAKADAATLATLPENTKVNVLGRQGAWSQVKADDKNGWIRLMHLKFDTTGAPGAQASGGSNPMGAMASLLTGGRTSNSAATTTGIKGLTADQVKNAAPNQAEFKKMQGYSATKGAAQSFSQRSKLSAAQVEYLADPAPAPTRNDPSSFQGG